MENRIAPSHVSRDSSASAAVSVASASRLIHCFYIMNRQTAGYANDKADPKCFRTSPNRRRGGVLQCAPCLGACDDFAAGCGQGNGAVRDCRQAPVVTNPGQGRQNYSAAAVLFDRQSRASQQEGRGRRTGGFRIISTGETESRFLCIDQIYVSLSNRKMRCCSRLVSRQAQSSILIRVISLRRPVWLCHSCARCASKRLRIRSCSRIWSIPLGAIICIIECLPPSHYGFHWERKR